MHKRTIQHSINISGIGQYTGKIINITLKSAQVNTGIVFKRVDVKNAKHNENVIKIGDQNNTYDTEHLNTKISNKVISITMVEHLLSSLYAMRITDLEIELDGEEVPMLDGGASYWIFLLRCAGVKEFEEKIEFIEINREFSVDNGYATITAKPYDGLKITYEIDFDCKTIGKNTYTFDIDKQNYFTDISLARTFCTAEQVENHKKLKKHFSNTDIVIYNDNKVSTANGILYFKNEPTRHKILDILGDFMHCGKFIKGEFICKKSGHSLNRQLVEEILKHF